MCVKVAIHVEQNCGNLTGGSSVDFESAAQNKEWIHEIMTKRWMY